MLNVRALVAAAILALILPQAAAAAPKPDPTMLAPVDALIAAINAGKPAAGAAAYTADAEILDEFAPFRWSGATAAATWFKDFAAFGSKAGMSKFHATHAKPTFVHAEAASAYVVVPTSVTYSFKGKAQMEKGAWTFVLVKQAGKWLVSSSAWAKISDTSEP